MWSWRVYTPLEDAARPIPDLAHLLGARIDVEVLQETCWSVDPNVDLRRARSSGTDGGVRASDVLLLRTRSARRYSANVECWVTHPKLPLRCGAGASDADALAEAAPWLLARAEDENSTPADAAALLRAIAQGQLAPPAVSIGRRKLRSLLPSESGVLVEQSDLSACGRLWRTVAFESTSPAKVRAAVEPHRDKFVTAGLVQSTPLFLRMLLRTAAADDGADGAADADVADVAGGIADAWVPAGSLSERLLDAWYDSDDVFTQRVWRAAQEHPPLWPPADGKPAKPAAGGPAAACDDAGDEASMWARYERELRSASGGAPTIGGSGRGGGSEPLTDAPPRGLLAQFPPLVGRRALGEVAAAGDLSQLNQLILASRGTECVTGESSAPGTDRPEAPTVLHAPPSPAPRAHAPSLHFAPTALTARPSVWQSH